MTTELHIRFRKTVDAVQASVHSNGSDTEPFVFTNPLSKPELTNLRWYVERYWQWPVGPDYERAQGIERDLPQLGKRLFKAIFDEAQAMRLFARFDTQRSQGALVTIDTTVPEVLGLPWELLADEGGYLFSKNPSVSIRRRMHNTRDLKVRQFELPVRVLMVICRPDGAGFMLGSATARRTGNIGRAGAGRVPAPAHPDRAHPPSARPAFAAGASGAL